MRSSRRPRYYACVQSTETDCSCRTWSTHAFRGAEGGSDNEFVLAPPSHADLAKGNAWASGCRAYRGVHACRFVRPASVGSAVLAPRLAACDRLNRHRNSSAFVHDVVFQTVGPDVTLMLVAQKTKL